MTGADTRSQILSKLDFHTFYSAELENLGKSNGKGYAKARCCFHSPDEEPSLSVNLHNGNFKCFGCGAKGDIFKFYMRKHNVDFKTAIERLAELAGVTLKNSAPSSNSKNPPTPPKSVKQKFVFKGLGKPVAIYNYRDADGKILYCNCRFTTPDGGKTFRQCLPDGIRWSLDGTVRVPYNLPTLINSTSDQIMMAEGEKDCDNLTSLGFVSTSTKAWQADFARYFADKSVVIFEDNDECGAQTADSVASDLYGVSKVIKLVKFTGKLPGYDVSDFIMEVGADEDAAEKLRVCADTAEPYRPKDLPRGFTAAQLLKMDLKPVNWAIPGILPQGLSILAAKPKMGKSMFALNAGIAISCGGKVLSQLDVEKGEVIYLSLEDTARRLKVRLAQMLNGDSPSSGLHLFPTWPRLDQKGLEYLEQEIRVHRDCRLVIIDTFARFRPATKNNNSHLYQTDYDHVVPIKSLADKYSLPILLIHHLRKSEAEDPMDTISGTLGLTGAADGILVLDRQTGRVDAKLIVTGRDVETAEYALQFHSPTLTWCLIGEARHVQSTNKKQALFEAVKNTGTTFTLNEIEKATGLKYKYIQKELPDLMAEGHVRKMDRGQYMYIPEEGDKGGKGDIEDNGDKGDKSVQSFYTEQRGDNRGHFGDIENRNNFSLLKHNTPIASVIPSSPCNTCKHNVFWKRKDQHEGPWVCSLCHPSQLPEDQIDVVQL